MITLSHYHPRIVDMVLEKGIQIHVSARGKEKIKEMKPRRYHCKDMASCVSKDAFNEDGFISSPAFANPLRRQSSFARVMIDVLFGEFAPSSLSGIFGKCNTRPIRKYRNLDNQFKGMKCSFDCAFRKGDDCHCVWRSSQFLTWGREENGKFVPLAKPIRSEPISMFTLAEKVKKYVGEEEWIKFCFKFSKNF